MCVRHKQNKQTKMAVIRTRKELFSWTDDEVELLLNVTLEYKTTKIQDNVDWESCKHKYTEIGDLFQAHIRGPKLRKISLTRRTQFHRASLQRS
ncbi:hypothetical protein OYC64_010293 [Pagothenia borchgrevinki]|uniref:Myb-like domain-containing protein n=1 Tax=Pagothenia borchgrevinki TaxID=8213 RepID=A0ABD2GVN4_PAGBO